jgi:uncharacterized membrane protein
MEILSLQAALSLIVAALVLLLPGTAIYLLARQYLDREQSFDLAGALLMGAGLSIAFWPILLLYTSLVGLSFSPIYLWVILAICALYVAYRIARGRRSGVSGQDIEPRFAFATVDERNANYRRSSIQ